VPRFGDRTSAVAKPLIGDAAPMAEGEMKAEEIAEAIAAGLL
jgi:hypothetical protein